MRRVKTRLPEYLAHALKGFVLDPDYTTHDESQTIQLVRFDNVKKSPQNSIL